MHNRLGAKLRYPADIDPEVVALCDAMNSLPGIATFESCCGHGKYPFSIWFTADDTEGLFFLTRCVDRRYWEFGRLWSITLSSGDTKECGLPTFFNLASCSYVCGDVPQVSMGENAYMQAKDLIGNMHHNLNNSAFMDEFGIVAEKFVRTELPQRQAETTSP